LTTTPTPAPPLEAAWTRFTSATGHAASVSAFGDFADSADVTRQRLGYVVLLRLAADPPAQQGRGRGGRGGGGRGRGGPAPEVVEAARAEARRIIDAGWDGPGVAGLLWAVGRVGAGDYAGRVEGLAGSANASVREASAFARTRLAASVLDAASPVTTAGPLVSAVAYEELANRLAGLGGDIAAGRRVFEQQGCLGCHTTAASEPEKGPFLGGIFTRYSRAEVIESIVRPSAKVAQGFATNTFTTSDGRQLAGFVVREGQDDVVIRDLTGAETTLRKAQIASRTAMEGSTMPPGLVDGVTLPELASLVAFLESTTSN
jgi:putative heme-binding domain-containing protein